MKLNRPLNLFYAEPDPDRWIKFDRYPRKILRRLARGKQKPGGVMMIALNLMKGLDKTGIAYRFNDYEYIAKHPKEVACIIGKPQLLFEWKCPNPIVFGAGIFSHPSDYPELLKDHPNIKRVLVPGPWMKKMFTPYYSDKVVAWPTGIDTEQWAPPYAISAEKSIDFLVYDKIRWERDSYESALLNPILTTLGENSLTYKIIRYGAYSPSELKNALDKSKAAIFLCEHETQGLAYQQILSNDVPILAWDRGGYWQDPYYYPAIKYGPVSSVPYWTDECGLTFTGATDFNARLVEFLKLRDGHKFTPRNYILDNLTLEKCAEAYTAIVRSVEQTMVIH